MRQLDFDVNRNNDDIVCKHFSSNLPEIYQVNNYQYKDSSWD